MTVCDCLCLSVCLCVCVSVCVFTRMVCAYPCVSRVVAFCVRCKCDASAGQQGEEFFLIESGTVSCTQAKSATDPTEMSLLTLGAGEYFGEMALMLDEPRAANCISKSAKVCFVLCFVVLCCVVLFLVVVLLIVCLLTND